jgi:enediyne biosynthesis protein E4
MKLLFLACVLAYGVCDGASATRILRVPGESEQETRRWLEVRKERQIAGASNSSVRADFTFRDGLSASGITFRHKVVDEAGKNFKPNHYDHGNAVAAADVDGDGKIDLFFVNQRGGNELWRNLGGAQFTNITRTAGIALADKVCAGASFGDIDNDGLPDLFVSTVRMGNHLFHNEGSGRFRDISLSAGVREVGHSSGAVFFDYDRDGKLDLFVCNVGVYTQEKRGLDGSYLAYDDAFTGFLKPERLETSVLYHNEGGLKFRNANEGTALKHREWSGDATFCDLEGSGFPGLYVLSMSGRNVYYKNDGGKKFTDATHGTFGRTPWGAMGLKFFDVNQDGRLDLYLTDMHSDMNTIQLQVGSTNRTEQFAGMKSEVWCGPEWIKNNWPGASTNFIFGNALFLNNTNGFVEASDRLRAETYWPWGISVGDLNADGFEDAFITSGMGYPLHYWFNSVLLNEKGKRFLHSEAIVGLEPRSDRKVLYNAFELDCDGQDRSNPFCQGKGGTVMVQASASSRSALIADLDDDGDLDLVIGNMNDAPSLLLSNLSEKRNVNFLKVRLQGAASNRAGLGALVTVNTTAGKLTQFHDGKSGYLSQSSLPLYFGLGEAALDSIEVLWPSGKSQKIMSERRGQRELSITEPL